MVCVLLALSQTPVYTTMKTVVGLVHRTVRLLPVHTDLGYVHIDTSASTSPGFCLVSHDTDKRALI